jgi:hypothetical protein
MKKIWGILLLVIVLGGAAFAQGVPAGPQQAVYINLTPTVIATVLGGVGLGGGYEYALQPNLSFLATVDMAGGSFANPDIGGGTVDYFFMNISAAVRHYFFNNAVTGFYVSLGIGDMFVQGKINNVVGGVNIFTIEADLGYKFSIGSNFFWEPYIGVAYRFAQGTDAFQQPFAEMQTIMSAVPGLSLNGIGMTGGISLGVVF